MGWRRLCRLPKNFLWLVTIAAHHHRPDDAGGLVGQCHCSNFGRLALQQSADPLAVACRSSARMAQHGNRAAVSRVRMYLSPRLLVRPKRSLPPLEFCRGVIPSQAANSRPDRNREGSATVTAIALAPIMPTPGTVANKRLTRFC